MTRRTTTQPQAVRMQPTTKVQKDRHKFQMRRGGAEDLLQMVSISNQVNRLMGDVLALAARGDWLGAGIGCADLVDAVSLACVTCEKRFEAQEA